MGTCIVFFYLLYTLFQMFIVVFSFTCPVQHIILDETCFNHEGALVLHCLDDFLGLLVVLFFLSIDVEEAIFLREERVLRHDESLTTQSLEERRDS